jgi:hypothetical protein
MAYGDAVGKGYAAGTATDSLAARDLGRPAVSGLTPMVQEVTHEITAVDTFIKTVTAAGTRVALQAAAFLVRRATIVALPTNSDTVVVGGANVVAAVGSQATPTMQGVPLNNPGSDAYDIEIDDLNKVYIDARVSGDGVSVTYWR